MSKQRQAGFTIVELMIALSVLSVVLLISTLTLAQLGRLFSKGLTQANTQNIARNLLNTVSSDIQFGNADPRVASAGSSTSFCLGATRYTYIPHTPLDASHPHVLWRDQMTTPDVCIPYDLTAYSNPDTAPGAVPGSGVELLGDNMQITSGGARRPSPNTYEISVTIAYGDNTVVQVDPVTGVTSCVSGRGSEFCAVAALTKIVTRRVSN